MTGYLTDFWFRLPLEPVGRRVLEKTILWMLGDGVSLNQRGPSPFIAMRDVKVLAQV